MPPGGPTHRRALSAGGGSTRRYGMPQLHYGKTKLRYIFTISDVRLACGSAVLTPANAASVPAVSLVWRSGNKQSLGGVARADDGQQGARWETPVSLKCSIYKSGQRTEPRLSEFVVKVEGVRTPRKLSGTLDLSAHASFDRTSSRRLPQAAPRPRPLLRPAAHL